MRSDAGVWSPLVAGETAARAVEAAEAIAHDLASEPAQAALGPGLGSGRSGLALLYHYLARSLGDAGAGERAELLLDQAIDGLAAQPTPAASLYHGFAGVAWVAEHLAGGDVSAEEEDPNAEIDAALASRLRGTPWREEIDLLGGLVGWGVYALERLPRPAAAEMLTLIVARLGECAEPGTPGAAWGGPGDETTNPDLGMAHGAAGVMALLAHVQAASPSPQAASLLAATVDGVLARLPVGEEDQGDLAWCAGHAGLSAALLAAARACARGDWERAARRLAAAAAERYLGEAEGFDPALCHGTAGLSHLFHRLHQATGDRALLAAAHRWLERTLARRQPGQGVGGYLCRGRTTEGRFGWVSDAGFLTGATGIALSLLAAAAPVEPAWDRLLLLSGPAVR